MNWSRPSVEPSRLCMHDGAISNGGDDILPGTRVDGVVVCVHVFGVGDICRPHKTLAM